MNKSIKLLLLASIFMSLLSFSLPTETTVGVYGVTENNPNKIELILNGNHTFSYKDLSNTKKKIEVTGDWKLKNGTISLMNYESNFSFHDKWKISDDGQTIKARKGLTFYSLMKK